jgi:hypothetical protein
LIPQQQHRKRRQQFFTAAGTCLPSCFLANDRDRPRLSFDTMRIAKKTTHPTILLLFRVFVSAGTCLPTRCLATIVVYTYRHIDSWEGFMKYATDMGSNVMTYIRSFIKIRSGIRKLIGGDTHTDRQTAKLSH